MQITCQVTQYEPQAQYQKKDGSTVQCATLSLYVGEANRFDAFGQPYKKPQVMKFSLFGFRADYVRSLPLQVGQTVVADFDLRDQYGHNELELFSLTIQQPAQPVQQPAYTQPAQFTNPQNPNQPW